MAAAGAVRRFMYSLTDSQKKARDRDKNQTINQQEGRNIFLEIIWFFFDEEKRKEWTYAFDCIKILTMLLLMFSWCSDRDFSSFAIPCLIHAILSHSCGIIIIVTLSVSSSANSKAKLMPLHLTYQLAVKVVVDDDTFLLLIRYYICNLSCCS